MYQQSQSERVSLRGRRALAASAILLAATVSFAAVGHAEPLQMNDGGVTVTPIEETETAISAGDRGHEMSPEIVNEPAMLAPGMDEGASPQIDASPAVEQVTDENPPVTADPMMQAAEEAAGEDGSNANFDPFAAGTDMEPSVEPAGVAETEPAMEPSPARAMKAADKPAAEPVKVAAVSDKNEVDIFDQWSQQKFSGREEKRPHPLAAEHPAHFVVVCEAGCAKDAADIVYMERRDARGPVNEKPLKSGDVDSTASIDCVGGCYSGRPAYAAVEATWDPSEFVIEKVGADNSWETTVEKSEAEAPSKKPNSSADGRWFDRIN